MDLRTKRVSSFLHLVLFLVCFLPASTYYALDSTKNQWIFFGLASTFILTPLFYLVFNLKNPIKSFPLSTKKYTKVLGLCFITSLVIIVFAKGFSNSIPNLSEIYTQRDEFKASTGALERYLIDWLANVFNIAILLFGLTYRKYSLYLLSLFIALYLFSLGGHKSFLFGVFIVSGLYILVYTFRQDLNYVTVLGLLTFLITVFILDSLSEKNYTQVSSLFIRRTLLLPSQIFYHYGDFFSENSLNLFSHNFPFKYFIKSPYDERIPEIIGAQFFQFRQGVYANGNVFADTFSNIGYFSFPLLGILLPLIYSILDWCTKNKPVVFSIPFVFMTSHTLLNSGLIVTLITHGLLVGVILAYLHPRIHSLYR